MKIYLASRYSRRLELCEYRAELESWGHTVTSRWLNGSHQIVRDGTPIGDNGERLVEKGDCDKANRLRVEFAEEDYVDVTRSDMVISFTEAPDSNARRGGRHVEFGVALQAWKTLVVIGYRENIFHYLPRVIFHPTWSDFMQDFHPHATCNV